MNHDVPDIAPSVALLSPPAAPPLLLDSTLREGEQTPGVRFSVDEKVHIARLLDAFGVDFIEAGHPAVSDEVRHGVRAVVDEGLDAQIIAHARALPADIDLARQCDVDWVGLFFCVRDAALEERFRKDLTAAERTVVDAVQYAVDHGLKVRYTPEDTVRSRFSTVVRIAQAAVGAGASRISIADTCGAMTPARMAAFVRDLQGRVDAPLNVHCHNDLGLAVANSIAAWESGATLIDTCVNGLGERCGITDLASLTATLATAYDHDRWDLTLLPRLAAYVAERSGVPLPLQAPITGTHAFSHNAGLHVAAVLVDPSHYENIPAARVGRDRTLVLDHMAGLQTVRHRLARLGRDHDETLARAVLRHVKNAMVPVIDDALLTRFYEEALREVQPAPAPVVASVPLPEGA